jgi:hypothetical protein
MNDHHLGDFIADVSRHLAARNTMVPAQYEMNEAQWLLECVKCCRTRIVSLENDAAVKLQARDKIALQLLPYIPDFDDMGQAMGRAFELADLFLEARKEPAIKTIVPPKVLP